MGFKEVIENHPLKIIGGFVLSTLLLTATFCKWIYDNKIELEAKVDKLTIELNECRKKLTDDVSTKNLELCQRERRHIQNKLNECENKTRAPQDKVKIYGVVVDDDTKEGIDGASVSIDGIGAPVTTNSAGYFEIFIEKDKAIGFRINASKEGYFPKNYTYDEDDDIRMNLTPR